jgi:hypothetical protein
MINPIIIAAIVLQAYIAHIFKLTGAILSYLITTGILLWGLSLYADNSGVAFLGFPLTQPIFLVLCLVWYVFDTRSLLRALKGNKKADTVALARLREQSTQAALQTAPQDNVYSYPGRPEGMDN